MPSIMYSGLCRPATYRARPCSSAGLRLFIVPCESLHTISVAPPSSAPSIAALTSPSSSRRPSSYACPGPRHCDQSTIPATPSMSNEMKTFTEDHYLHSRTPLGASPAPPGATAGTSPPARARSRRRAPGQGVPDPGVLDVRDPVRLGGVERFERGVEGADRPGRAVLVEL